MVLHPSEAPNNAIVRKAVAVPVTREGNPQNIQGWEALARDDGQVVTADPKNSGGYSPLKKKSPA